MHLLEIPGIDLPDGRLLSKIRSYKLARAFDKEGNALLLIARHMRPVDELAAERTIYAQADVAGHAALERAIRDDGDT